MRHWWKRPAGWLVLASIMTSCVDGSSPVAVDTGMVHIAAAPVFSSVVASAEAAALNRARVTALRSGDGSVLATVEQAIDPNASEWVVTVEFEIPVGQPIGVLLQVELASDQSVEWSGRTSGFEVTAGTDPQEIRLVRLYRGPAGNLGVTGIDLRGPESILTGQSAELQAGVSGGSGNVQVFYSSLEPSIATVDGSGRVQGVSAGVARVVAAAGPASDTLVVAVREAVLADADEIARTVTPGIEDTAGRITGSMGDAAGAAAISSALTNLGAALASRDAALAVAAFEDARNAWASYGGASNLRLLDAPQLGLIEITLIHAADALGIAFG